MIKTGRRYGASCFSIFSADLSGARPRRSDRRYRAFAPWAPLLSVSIPSILCTGVGENVSRHFLQSLLDKSLVRLSRFRAFFPVRMPSCFCPFFVQFRLIAAKIGKTKFSRYNNSTNLNGGASHGLSDRFRLRQLRCLRRRMSCWCHFSG